MAGLYIISWNVRGLNSPIKRTRCLEFLHRKSVSIALIQESHLRSVDVHRFQNKQFKLVAHSCADTKTTGVLILVRRKLQISIDYTENLMNGRCVCALVEINNTKMLLASVYAPNIFNPSFFISLEKSLSKFPDIPLIIGGDFNSYLDPVMDRSSGGQSSHSISSLAFKTFIFNLNLVDLWRFRNNNLKDFSFYSARHHTYSRIYYICVSPSLINSIPHITMLPILISDHSPILCNITPSAFTPKFYRWRFNDSLLTNSEFMVQINQQIKEFVEINRSHCKNPQILWETCKCFIRGFCIAFSSKLKVFRTRRMSEIEQEVQTLEGQQKVQFTEQRSNTISALRGEYNSLSLHKAEFIHNCSFTQDVRYHNFGRMEMRFQNPILYNVHYSLSLNGGTLYY
uniref:exodeoxyribonuclease III n=1 Tax=Cyprinus carpio TaxID=7962 RepID=A0A8C2C1Q9_CYPCA